jgi:murein DD-endopeptidase MepM/ murein hydrolase activator NlpD
MTAAMTGAPGTMPAGPVRRLRRGMLLGVVSTATMLVLCCGGAAAYFLDGLGSKSDDVFAYACGQAGHDVDPDGDLPRMSELGDEQMRNAAIIVDVGQKMNVPPRGWVIAIATALQESWLRNLEHLGDKNDHDSLGLFQQRPSVGTWGTAEEIRNPVHAATKFYEHLLEVNGWETMSLTDAAQAVQISAFPDAYAKHEPLATQIVNKLTNGAGRAVGTLVNLKCANAGEIAASGWTTPLKGDVVSSFRTASRPSHNGVDIGVAKGTEIHAAAAGTVTRVRCNAIAPNGSDWGCYRDGSPSVRGCGWYVDILHAGGIMTRYCHQVTQPRVLLGQQVAAGEVIGWSGSTGNSSGPHLHYEVHTGGDSSSKGAIDPVPFMQQVGAPLGSST